MNRFLLIAGGLCGAIATFLILRPARKPVQKLAHELEDAWSDYHTVV